MGHRPGKSGSLQATEATSMSPEGKPADFLLFSEPDVESPALVGLDDPAELFPGDLLAVYEQDGAGAAGLAGDLGPDLVGEHMPGLLFLGIANDVPLGQPGVNPSTDLVVGRLLAIFIELFADLHTLGLAVDDLNRGQPGRDPAAVGHPAEDPGLALTVDEGLVLRSRIGFQSFMEGVQGAHEGVAEGGGEGGGSGVLGVGHSMISGERGTTA